MPQAYEIANPDNVVNVTEDSYAIRSGSYAWVGETAEEVTPTVTVEEVTQPETATVEVTPTVTEEVSQQGVGTGEPVEIPEQEVPDTGLGAEVPQQGVGTGEVQPVETTSLAQPTTRELSEETQAIVDQVTSAGSLSPELLESATSNYESGILSEEEYADYLTRYLPDATTAVVEAEALLPTFDYTPSETVQLTSIFSTMSELGYDGITSQITALLSDEQSLSEMSSYEVNQLLLAQAQITGATSTYDAISAQYQSMADRYADIYESAQDTAAASRGDISDIEALVGDFITTGDLSASGLLELASSVSGLSADTSAGLAAQVAAQSAFFSAASATAQEEELQAQYEYTYGQLADQNMRVEAYMKAKLNYMGASDSSAGLTMMNVAIQNSQDALTAYSGEYNAQILQLEILKSQSMATYYTAVQEQILTIDSNEAAALEDFNAALDEIELSEIASLQEMNTQSLAALSEMTTNLYTIQTQQQQWEYDLAVDSYNRAMTEMSWVQAYEQQETENAAERFSSLMTLYAGTSFDDLTGEIRTQMMDDATLMGMPSSFVEDSLQAIADADPERDWQVSYITDDAGGVIQVLFDANSGETVMNSLGSIGKTSGTSGSGSGDATDASEAAIVSFYASQLASGTIALDKVPAAYKEDAYAEAMVPQEVEIELTPLEGFVYDALNLDVPTELSTPDIQATTPSETELLFSMFNLGSDDSEG